MSLYKQAHTAPNQAAGEVIKFVEYSIDSPYQI